MNKNRFIQIIRRYIGAECVYGKNDCNLLVMDLYEPEYYNKLVNNYTTVLGGYRLSKQITGHFIAKHIIQNSDKYEEIPCHSASFGDIGFCKHTHSTILIIGKSFISPVKTEDGIFFMENSINNIDEYEYNYYRRL